MSVVELEPDDVLMGVGRYRDAVDVVCPSCDAVTDVDRGTDETTCADCGDTIEIESPFE